MVLHFCPSCIEKLQEAAKLVTTLQEQVVLSLQTSFREGQLSEFCETKEYSSLSVDCMCTNTFAQNQLAGRNDPIVPCLVTPGKSAMEWMLDDNGIEVP